eukprot:5901864-Prymnesium_polylepis.1
MNLRSRQKVSLFRPSGAATYRECAVQVLVRRQKRPTRSFTGGHKRAVNTLLPRGSPSRHGALLAHESTVSI